MAKVCEIVNEATNHCELWIQFQPWWTEFAITRDQALTLCASFAGIYTVLIAWSVIVLIYQSSK